MSQGWVYSERERERENVFKEEFGGGWCGEMLVFKREAVQSLFTPALVLNSFRIKSSLSALNTLQTSGSDG